MWYENVIEGLAARQIINDSKTPSGRVHVGSLRGVLIHDALYRALQDKGLEATFKYGVDDYDPLDGLPADAEPYLQDYMGYPLCNIPAPAGSPATDLADHYITEFLGIFPELGVNADIYRMRDVYRCGRFNEAIDIILSKAAIVRKIYAEVSRSARPDHWHPYQVICENCSRIGTTEVIAYDGKEVTYRCRRDLVNWATGCGHEGKIAPFDGHGKLPWKLEWAAKWHTFGVTIEGAGKDHCTKGGSRDVAARCLQALFGEQPPLNVPYEFFLVSGAKMSSSKGIGVAAREMAAFLPPEILRFLMIRTPPKRTVNFATDFEYMVRLFNEHDRLLEEQRAGRAEPWQETMLRMIEVNPHSTAYHPVGFQLLTALLQLPHIDIEAEIDKRTAGGLSQQDKDNLRKRIAAAQYWLAHYASDEDRVELQQELPPSAALLSATQKAFVRLLGEHFPSETLDEDGYQKYIFDTARLTPISQNAAFSALYRVLLDKERGPKGGALFCYLDREFLIKRFKEVSYSRAAFWSESAISADACKTWFAQQHILNARASKAMNVLIPADRSSQGRAYLSGKGVLEIEVTLADEKVHLLRVLLSVFAGDTVDLEAEANSLEARGNDLLAELAASHGIRIENLGRPRQFEESQPDDQAVPSQQDLTTL